MILIFHSVTIKNVSNEQWKATKSNQFEFGIKAPTWHSVLHIIFIYFSLYNCC